VDAFKADALFAAMPDESFLRFRPEQLAWQATAIRGAEPGETRVRARHIADDANAMEVFVYSPDRDGLFAAILATLDRKGFAIHQARVLVGPNGTIFDTFEVLPTDSYAPRNPSEVEHALSAALDGPLDRVRTSRRAVPRQLKHFRFAPRIEFGTTPDGRRTVLNLVAPDRPGLLSDVAQVLRGMRLRVHDARIATFGERAEDIFQITDERDLPITDEAQQQALGAALRASLDNPT
jgi:[protein-PII] uridylyltransferase